MKIGGSKPVPARSGVPLPPIARRELSWFARYITFYLRRNFHALHLLRLSSLERVEGYPLLVCLNHPSWWDPLIGLYLSQRFFANRRHYAPIAAAEIAQYRFFERLGFFSVGHTHEGAARFLRIGQAALHRADGALWMTPQGAFTDVRRPLVLEPGVGRLATHLERFAMLPIALEYSFWSERFPEAFACLGDPVFASSGGEHSAAGWNAIFARACEETADALSARVQARDPSLFEPLLEGSAGVGGFYDRWRVFKARLQGKAWQPEHGSR
jgi:1-acyl-sn-glycerol-3-phosphate acyltransferase